MKLDTYIGTKRILSNPECKPFRFVVSTVELNPTLKEIVKIAKTRWEKIEDGVQ